MRYANLYQEGADLLGGVHGAMLEYIGSATINYSTFGGPIRVGGAEKHHPAVTVIPAVWRMIKLFLAK